VSVLKREKALLVLNKIDRIDDKRLLLPLTERFMKLHSFIETVPVSARKADGLEELKSTIIQYLPEGEPVFAEDQFTDQPLRFLASEIIREKILNVAQKEVPHAVAVLVEQWEEMPNLTKIAATIHVEKTGQRAILIGANGEMLKRIGTDARLEIEQLTGKKVFLSLFVKVKPNWREDPAFLNAIDWRAMVGSK
jgi:GTPase